MQRWIWVLAVVAAIVLGVGLATSAQEKAKERKAQLTFEIYKDAQEGFRWRLKAANGQIIGTSGQGYKAKADCQHGIKVIMDGAANAKVEDVSAK